MELNITGQHLEITDSLRNHINTKVEPMKQRFSRITHLRVSLHIDHNDQVAEGNVHIDGIELHASAKSDDMYASIDQMFEKLFSQVEKHKDILIDHHR